MHGAPVVAQQPARVARVGVEGPVEGGEALFEEECLEPVLPQLVVSSPLVRVRPTPFADNKCRAGGTGRREPVRAPDGGQIIRVRGEGRPVEVPHCAIGAGAVDMGRHDEALRVPEARHAPAGDCACVGRR